MKPVIDGQKQPKPTPSAPVNLIDPDLQLAGLPLVKEGLSMSTWLAADDFADTVKMDLTELRG